MPRIVDKDTRIIDVDFGSLNVTINRSAGQFNPDLATFQGNGVSQLLNRIPDGNGGCGTYVQYQRLDLSFMLKENEIMLPVNVNSQRTSPVPLGFSNNGNTFDQVEEYIYIFTRPLNNTDIGNLTSLLRYENFRNLGLDGSEMLNGGFIEGQGGSVPNLQQTVYAEKRMYGTNTNLIATVANGVLQAPPANPDYNTIEGMMGLQSVTTWGSMDAITGPNLHCYRIVIDRAQTLPIIPNTFANEQLPGQSQRRWPPVNVSFLCKDPNYSEGEYLTRLANAMANTPEDGPTA